MATWSIEFVRKYVEIDEGLVACSDTETGLCLQSAYVMLRRVFVYVDQKSYVHLSGLLDGFTIALSAEFYFAHGPEELPLPEEALSLFILSSKPVGREATFERGGASAQTSREA
jgi:hypothetical protein